MIVTIIMTPTVLHFYAATYEHSEPGLSELSPYGEIWHTGQPGHPGRGDDRRTPFTCVCAVNSDTSSSAVTSSSL